MINSPITNSKTLLVKNIEINVLIEAYKSNFSIDVASYFKDIKDIKLYKCEETRYKFYYPFHIIGDSKFYEQLQQFDWYYMSWKWEYERAFKNITPKSKVLEIGCAEGHFLQKLKDEKQCNCVGLEFNEKAIAIAKNKGIDVRNLSINEFVNKNEGQFDVICSFQVLEHIPDVKEFLNAQVKCLKKGGKLIISVPNNDSFIKDSFNILNMPPHHMGLWNKKSLKRIAPIFGLSLEKVYFEQLQEYHRKYFLDTLKDKVNNRYFNLLPYGAKAMVLKVVQKFIGRSYKAFTIQVIYHKMK